MSTEGGQIVHPDIGTTLHLNERQFRVLLRCVLPAHHYDNFQSKSDLRDLKAVESELARVLGPHIYVTENMWAQV